MKTIKYIFILFIFYSNQLIFSKESSCKKMPKCKIKYITLRGPRGFRGCRGPRGLRGPRGEQGPPGVCNCSQKGNIIINCSNKNKDDCQDEYCNKNLNTITGVFSYVNNNGTINITNSSNKFNVNYIITNNDNIIFSITFKKPLEYNPIISSSCQNGIINIFNISNSGFFIKCSDTNKNYVYFIGISTNESI